ncbi:MAG: hypothetical protein COU81_01830 [Candidatus Portnoybacteria bacterium CG10_big_fil_rev_8_21_14_0_10_36_7]|uniref:AtpZ/AtpI family protein n=1 Tax=Candidatus Portnoybacteria bacterium CG10_big_fil_rev_8_21_14_0_10_36_7 TaxID=1974812 RepID=A0A2M8KE80_9BACT|nr:MAG: hypothetical protein COU81_01830 [Candidatus Portnoybacteria bacterium CG10_big_fil_rev_8_21_14_0_10_36_7]
MINAPNDNPWWQPGLILFTRLSGWIAGPIIIAVFIGRWLDNKFHTAPWLFIIIVSSSFIISMVGLVKETMSEMKRIDNQNNKNVRNN